MKCSIRILMFGIGFLLLTSALIAQRQTFVPPSDLSFKVSTDRRRYRTGEAIIVKYRVKNISNAPLYIPREWEVTCPASPHLWAWFEDGSGKHFVPGYGGSCSSGPKALSARMSKEAVLLKPGEYFDGTFRLDSKLLDLKPGTYRIEAALTGWDEEKFSGAERSELAQMLGPFMAGEVSDSTTIKLSARAK